MTVRPHGAPGVVRVSVARMRRPSLRGVGIALAIAGIFSMGVASGRLLMPIDHTAGEPIVLSPSAPGVSSAATTVPDVAGLEVADARAVWADAGLAVDQIEIGRRPHAGAEGTVVSQVPDPGSLYERGTRLFLAVSQPGVVPDLVGKTSSDAQSVMSELGASLNVTERFAPKVAPGTILSSTPAAGAPLDAVVAVVVASAGDSVYLANLDDELGDCGVEDSVTMGSSDLGPSLLCDPYDGESATARYALAGLNGVVEGTLMMVADGATATVAITADGTPMGSFAVPGDGSPVPVHVELASVSVLELQVVTAGDGSVALGELRVTGPPKAIALLAGES